MLNGWNPFNWNQKELLLESHGKQFLSGNEEKSRNIKPDADKKHRENKNENIVVLVHLLFSDVGKREQDRHEKELGFSHKKICFFFSTILKRCIQE